ncbi:MAG: methyltransferase family protein [Leucobacter sp.]
MIPAAIALGLYTAYLLLTFGLRAWLLYRRTGSTGFNGFTERRGSAGWWGGILFAAAVVLGLAAPILQLAGLLRPVPFLEQPVVFAFGLILTLAGAALTLAAQQAMGRSWRVGVDHSETTELVRGGMFALVRNPIFTAVILTAIGLALVAPNPLAIAAALTLIVAVELQVRAVEEPYLIATHGDPYLAYARTVGRFVPGIGTLTRSRPLGARSDPE